MTPVLSICIPSYNRSGLLGELLREMDRPDFLPFPFEIIVSDNASSDPGYAEIAVYKPVNFAYEYVRQPENIGAFRNILGVCRRARGTFCLHLADDDRLIPDEVAAIVATMRQATEVLASFAACEIYDGAADRIIYARHFEELTVGRHDAALLADRLGSGSLCNPENGIFRTDSLSLCFYPTPVTYYSYRLVERLLRIGQVRFHAAAFYRFYTQHGNGASPQANVSARLGIEGHEAMARSVAVLHRSATGRPISEVAAGGLPRLYLGHLATAAQEANEHGQFLEAAEIMDYVAGLTESPVFASDWTVTHQAAAFDAIARTIGTLPVKSQVRLVGLGAGADPLRELLRNASPTIAFSESPVIVMKTEPDEVLVTATDAVRDMIVARHAVRPGYVFSLESAFRAFGIEA